MKTLLLLSILLLSNAANAITDISLKLGQIERIHDRGSDIIVFCTDKYDITSQINAVASDIKTITPNSGYTVVRTGDREEYIVTCSSEKLQSYKVSFNCREKALIAKGKDASLIFTDSFKATNANLRDKIDSVMQIQCDKLLSNSRPVNTRITEIN